MFSETSDEEFIDKLKHTKINLKSSVISYAVISSISLIFYTKKI